MADREIVILAMTVAYLLLCTAGSFSIIILARRQKPKHVRIDPPKNDTRLVMIENENQAGIDFFKEQSIYLISLIYNSGRLNQSSMWKLIKKHHNKHYDMWPELKAYHISSGFFRTTVAERELGKSGQRVISIHRSISLPEMATQYDDEFVPYVVMEDRTTRKPYRKLVSVFYLAQEWHKQNDLGPAIEIEDENSTDIDQMKIDELEEEEIAGRIGAT